MSPITTHVLDTSSGEPARGVTVHFERRAGAASWAALASAVTNPDGRVAEWTSVSEAGAAIVGETPADSLPPGLYRLSFDVGAYFAARGVSAFFPEVQVSFEVAGAPRHYHIPLLLSPYGYSTYRGS